VPREDCSETIKIKTDLLKGEDAMERIGLIEKSNAFQYAMLSTKVSQLLVKVEKGVDLTEQEYETLKRGANLLRGIIEGSLLLERKKASVQGFYPSQDGLLAYGHALSAVKELNMIRDQKDFTELFLPLYKSMDALLKKEKLEREVLSTLKNFFNKLSKLFSDDIQKGNFNTPKESLSSLRMRSSKFIYA
jgi:hypothetical protein